MPMLSLVGPRKIRVSPEGVAAFNAGWPCSRLRASRAYWFEFDLAGELIDTDVPEQDDGREAEALAEYCYEWHFDGVAPAWSDIA